MTDWLTDWLTESHTQMTHVYLQSKTLSEIIGFMSYLGIEGPMAFRPGLKSKDQTLVWAVKREWKVGEQVALILHKERHHSARVLVIRQNTNHTKAGTIISSPYWFPMFWQGIFNGLSNSKTSWHNTLYNCIYYRIIKLDCSDVILGKSNASILRMDE